MVVNQLHQSTLTPFHYPPLGEDNVYLLRAPHKWFMK
jgi:hypothetical protein